ncbi:MULTISPECIES: HAD family hydrolase [Paenibacillus]|uniref:HAD family hydrolase n=1 Tax=Paenibacillus TaxID=44249 RepID=UPI00211B24E3|nr:MULTISPECIES: HAD family hydrolase [Paenibacillus]
MKAIFLDFYGTVVHEDDDILPVAESLNQEQLAHWRKPGIFADSIPFLHSLEIPIYLLSNIDTDDVKAAMKAHNIEVDGVITSEDVRSYKPRSEMFDEAINRYGLQRDKVIHIGDSLVSDVQGAQNAGIKAVWLNRKSKSKWKQIIPDYECKDLGEVVHMLEGWA